MASSYVPYTIPLLEGMRQDHSSVDGSKPRLSYAQNIDFSIAGHLQGRQGWTERTVTMQGRTFNPVSGPATFSATLGSHPFKFESLFRYRDSNGERPGVYALGRVWTREDSTWSDRLYAGAARVERLAESGTGATLNGTPGYNFFTNVQSGAPPFGITLLADSSPSGTTQLGNTVTSLYGGACDVISGADVYHCVVGNNAINNVLTLAVRKNNDLAISSFTINVVANDCETISILSSTMWPRAASDPSSASAGGTACLWVAYKQNAAANLKFARINPITGAILSSVVYAVVNPVGFWLSTDAADNRIYTIVSRTGTNDAQVDAHNATTLANLALGFAWVPGGVPNGSCVIGGVVPLSRVAYVAMTTETGGVGSTSTVSIGTYRSVGPTASNIKQYFGSATVAGTPGSSWTIAHQPILVGSIINPRIIIGLHWVAGDPATANFPGTWYSVDLTNIPIQVGNTTYGTFSPGILARGPLGESVAVMNGRGPVHAIPAPPVANYVSAWRFPWSNYTSFNAAGTGSGALYGLNQVTLIQPKAATIGEETILSGSVPHMLARGYSSEVGFVLGAPEIELAVAAGGALTAGSYTFQACWKWIDEAGVIHRSGFSKLKSASTAGGNLTINIRILNSQFTEREFKTTGGAGFSFPHSIEVYGTGINPATTSLRFLQVELAETPGAAVTLYSQVTPTVTTSEAQYTSGGVFQNSHVSADGGIAVVGRRVWMSNGRAVFASKLYTPGNKAPCWNSEGILQVNIPAPAGKVVALENMGDKLVILCQRGILVSYGEGPDDTGVGPGFVFPITVSPLGVSSELASVSTPRGVVFHANNTIDNAFGVSPAMSGGLFLYDGGGVSPVGVTVNRHLKAGPAQLSYLPERELLLVNNYNTTGLIDAVPNILMLDMRSGNWSVWTTPNQGVCFGLTEAAGVLYGGFLAGHGSALVASLDRNDGKDNDPGFSDANVKMAIQTNSLYADGAQVLGWTRVRAVSVQGDYQNPAVPSHTLTVSVTADGYQTPMSKAFVYSTASTGTTWPTNQLAPEFRLPQQKMNQLSVQLAAVPAVAQWHALRLDVLPLETRAPAGKRG